MIKLKLTSIQILRGIAAVWVVLAHATGLAANTGSVNGIVKFISGYGWCGVDIFFVVSGFVIFYAVHGNKIAAGQFFARRLERIAPPYLLLTTLLFSIMLARPEIFHTLQASFDHYVRSALFVSFTGYEYPVLYIGWTLEYEMFFYLLAALALVFGMLAFEMLPVLISVFVLLGGILKQAGLASAAVAFLTNPVMLEFCFGFFVASVFLTRKVNTYVAVALVVATLSILLTQPAHRVIQAGLASAGLLSVCLLLTHHVTLPARLRSVLSAIGDASYSIYLIQVFSLPLADKLQRYIPRTGDSTAFALTATIFTVLCGWIFFRVVEQPVLQLIRSKRRDRAARLAALETR